ncbi:MAG: hypothetical protein IH957_13450 [Chloroflexi bacterium]|nr:hypothetical protein [Chloroflexota bacterium]
MTHYWIDNRDVGKLFQTPIGLTTEPAWDVYLLYGPGVTWEQDGPPQPAFWMHQLGVEVGVDPDLRLDATRLYRELIKLLGDGVEPSSPNLGLILHAKGLSALTRERP